MGTDSRRIEPEALLVSSPAVSGHRFRMIPDTGSVGHATPAFTMTVYQHVLPGMQAEAATTFAELVFGPE